MTCPHVTRAAAFLDEPAIWPVRCVLGSWVCIFAHVRTRVRFTTQPKNLVQSAPKRPDLPVHPGAWLWRTTQAAKEAEEAEEERLEAEKEAARAARKAKPKLTKEEKQARLPPFCIKQ